MIKFIRRMSWRLVVGPSSKWDTCRMRVGSDPALTGLATALLKYMAPC